MTSVLSRAADFIAPFEGCSLTAYKCPAGIWTVGFGHTRNVTPETSLTQEEALALLQEDLAISYKAVQRLIKYPLKENQIIALIDFTFNLGSGSLQRSSLRSKINRGDVGDAASEFLKWNRAGGVVLKGLTKRREAERRLFLA